MGRPGQAVADHSKAGPALRAVPRCYAKVSGHYARVVRKRQGELRQYDLPSEQDFMLEVGHFLCECYRMGAAGEPSPLAETFEAEAQALYLLRN